MRAIGELLALSHVQREVALMRGCSLVFATTTGMAMRHRRLREGGIAFPLVMMEEAAKVLETEALTCFAHGVERIVLIGDHLQLPPLVAADSLRSASVNYSQSLFARLLRAGVAPITLNRQGRAAPGIADLYRFRYDNLLDLPAARGTRRAGRCATRPALSMSPMAASRTRAMRPR
jgi:intron-binding protein aquarius